MQNVKAQCSFNFPIRNAKCHGVMQFFNSECKMSRRNAVSQFGMQNVKAQCSFPIRNAKCQGAIQFSIQNATAQCSFPIRNAKCQGAMQFSIRNAKAQYSFPIRNAKCQGAKLIINFDIRCNGLEFKMKILCKLSHVLYFWREL